MENNPETWATKRNKVYTEVAVLIAQMPRKGDFEARELTERLSGNALEYIITTTDAEPGADPTDEFVSLLFLDGVLGYDYEQEVYVLGTYGRELLFRELEAAIR